MATFKMMDEVIHYCTKCKLDLNHRIIRVEAGVPKRVLCLTCQSDRLYRDRSRPPASKGVARVKRASASKEGDQESEWKRKRAARDQVPKPYGIDEVFALDRQIEHRSFGVGLVVALIHPDKMRVYFEDGVKILKRGNPVVKMPPSTAQSVRLK